MKLYAKQTVAESVAKKLSKDGKTFVVQEVDGQFAVVEQGAEVQPEAQGDLPAIVTGENGEPVANPELFGETSEAAPEAAPEAEEIVTVHFTGARLTPNYIITPPVGTSKKGPVERWIERKRVKSAEATETGVLVVMSAKGLKSRGIDPAKHAVATAVAA